MLHLVLVLVVFVILFVLFTSHLLQASIVAMTTKAAVVQIHGYIELILAIFHRMFYIAAREGCPSTARYLRGRLGRVDHDCVRKGLVWVMMRIHSRHRHLALSYNLLLDTGLLQAPSSHSKL